MDGSGQGGNESMMGSRIGTAFICASRGEFKQGY